MGKPKPKKDKPLLACKVVVLEDVNQLAKKYRGKFQLTLKTIRKKGYENYIDPTQNMLLVQWETLLNKICHEDPVIAVENFVDNEGPPDNFTYVRQNITHGLANDLLDPNFLAGCECFPRCSQNTCSCPKNSGHKFAYDRNKRVLLPPQSPIYECNKRCKCGDDCPNRVLQKGLTVRVCIFRTDNGRGWGLKTREFIPKDMFVVEYVGEVITSDDAERRGKLYDERQQTYLFDLDFNGDPTFTIDAHEYGNVSHFINHSCDPNLRVFTVWVDTLDPRLPRLGLFALRDIKQGEELTFDYTCGQKESKTSNEIKMYCACGAPNCRKYLF
ncbi:histone-lysine N-methyltransferase SUV39H2 [Hydra vulgaris]|uniref:Histone-lysine N-methyltransferase n=1 Tax=Hydra vulgaris TaxID=6087 RepID=A0ABM4DJE0_HYDVU